MTGRMLMSALAGALAVIALYCAWQTGLHQAESPSAALALSALDGREVFDADGTTLGVVEQTFSARHGERAARYAMVRVSRSGNAGLRLAVPVYRLQPFEDGLVLTAGADDDDEGDFHPTAAQLRGRT